MPRLKTTAARYGLHIAIPALIVLAGTIFTVVVSLDRMAGIVNRIEDTLSRRSTEAAARTVLHRLGQSHRDYAEWDDAARRLYGVVEPDFISETFESASATQTFFDTAYVLDEEGNPLVGVRLGKPSEIPLSEAFGPALATLMDGLAADGRTYEVRTGLVAAAWGLTAIAVGPIVPASIDFTSPPTRSRYLVFAKALDATALDLLAGEYLIDGLRFVAPGESPHDELDLVDPRGQKLAALTWSPGKLGSQAHADVGPLVTLMLGLVVVTVTILIVIAIRGLNRIKISEDLARYAASHDALTGLTNRAALLRHLGDKTASARRDGGGASLIYLDLDGFKEVNDAYGHDVGDRLLRNVAAGFQTICGERPVARVGGDEFAIVSVGDNPVEKAIDTGRLLIRYLAQPFDIDGRVIFVGTSIGIAAVDSTVASPEEVLRRADVAMYQAKQQGRNRIVVYESSIDVARHRKLEIAAELGAALRSDDLEIAYQPLLSAATRRIVGAEALLRWPRQGGAPLSADVFVPIAEETGLIDELGAWVLRRACRDAGAWPDINIAVNVSPAQLKNPNFEILVQRVLAETGLQPHRLELEVTENYLVSNPAQARQSINAIRNLGVSVALDDFGTGYSSIGYLRSFAFDKLKLDRSLIAGIATDQRAQRFVQATIALADSLGLGVVAEGVENEEEAILLRLAGCRELQGYFFAPPCPAAEFTRMLDAESDDAGRSSAASA